MRRLGHVRKAYERLFGPALDQDDEVLIDARVLKRLHRRRAFELHPDRAAALGRSPRELEHELKELNAAYDILRREAELQQIPRRTQTTVRQSAKRTSDHCWRGRVPRRGLPFGEYLYYRSSISWAALVDALAWQKSQRPMLGEIARREGVMDSFSVAHVQRSRQRHERFGDCAVRLGYLSPRELRALLATQFAYQDRIGRYFIDRGWLACSEVEELARAHRAHNAEHA